MALLVPVIFHGVYNFYGTYAVFPILTLIMVITIIYFYRREQLKRITEDLDKSRIKNIILDNRINLVHIRSRAPAWSAYYASKNLCRSVSTYHNVYGHENLYKKYYNKGLSKVDKIVTISEYVKNSIVNIYNITIYRVN